MFSAQPYARNFSPMPAGHRVKPPQEAASARYLGFSKGIVQGDCVEVMAAWPAASINFILTDPPYLVNYCDRAGRSIANDVHGDWLKPAFAQMYRLLEPDSFCVSFYGWSKTDLFYEAWKSAGFRVVGHLTFPKRYASKTGFMRYQHENAYLLAKGRPAQPVDAISDVQPWVYSGNRLHPTQKPVEVLQPMVGAFSRPGGCVLDPFAGSGSTCVAAHQAGRRYLGIELDPQFHQVASERLQAIDKGPR
jgi:adenine-specific DNA-methyltransferase